MFSEQKKKELARHETNSVAKYRVRVSQVAVKDFHRFPSPCCEVGETLHLGGRIQKFFSGNFFCFHRQRIGGGCGVGENKGTLALLLMWRSLISQCHSAIEFVPFLVWCVRS